MTVKEFVDTYKNAAKPDEFIKKHVKNVYIPYSTKVATCEGIVKASSIEKIGDVEVYKTNSPAQFFLFTMAILEQYTDLDINKGSLEQYDMLSEFDLINKIAGAISKTEYDSYSAILGMINDDYYENNRSIGSYLEAFKGSLSIIMDSLGKLPQA